MNQEEEESINFFFFIWTLMVMMTMMIWCVFCGGGIRDFKGSHVWRVPWWFCVVTLCVPLKVNKFVITESFKLLVQWTLVHWDAGLFYFFKNQFHRRSLSRSLAAKISLLQFHKNNILTVGYERLDTGFAWPVNFLVL